MELVEPIERINELLFREFGREFNGDPKFRVVFSEDQFEDRFVTHTPEGIELQAPTVRRVPKYRHYMKPCYVLERLVPVTGETDLTTRISYEPAWAFVDKRGNYLPPQYELCKYIIDTLHSQMDKAGSYHAKYKDDTATKEARAKEIQDMEDRLFGNETSTGDALAHKWGVTVPTSYEKESVK